MAALDPLQVEHRLSNAERDLVGVSSRVSKLESKVDRIYGMSWIILSGLIGVAVELLLLHIHG